MTSRGRAGRHYIVFAAGWLAWWAAGPVAAQVAKPDAPATRASPDPNGALRISAVDPRSSGSAPFTAPTAGAVLSATDPATALGTPRLPIAAGRQTDPAGTGKLFLAGVGAAAVGSLIGMYVGYQLDRGHFHWGCERGCDDPGLYGLMGGWSLGPALTTPLGVHHANGRRGALGRSYASSALIAGGTVAAIAFEAWAFAVLAAPVLHLVGAVTIESGATP
ncbi:MAG: hypothetical protein ACODAE_08420 [Gemmatimonadota bacterium]